MVLSLGEVCAKAPSVFYTKISLVSGRDTRSVIFSLFFFGRGVPAYDGWSYFPAFLFFCFWEVSECEGLSSF